jgi:hypothetical protein
MTGIVYLLKFRKFLSLQKVDTAEAEVIDIRTASTKDDLLRQFCSKYRHSLVAIGVDRRWDPTKSKTAKQAKEKMASRWRTRLQIVYTMMPNFTKTRRSLIVLSADILHRISHKPLNKCGKYG